MNITNKTNENNNVMFMNKALTTPVLFLIFNRPDLTEKVFNVIREVKPSILFIAADGPRQKESNDISNCNKVRDIVRQVDWDCQVKTLYRDRNLGCRVAISSAINWFFENVEEGIILEDDCLPSESFFWFCQELLEKYRNDERVMQINGNNYLFGKKKFMESYYFSKLNGCWGWATWKRAWKHFDEEMKGFSRFKKENQIDNYIANKEISGWLMSYLDEAARPNCGIWSTQWAYTIIIRNGLSISPMVNLVQNTGFGENATHGKNKSFELYSKIVPEEMEQIVHPQFVLPDNEADNIQFEIIGRTDPRLLYDNRLRLKDIAGKYLPQPWKVWIKKRINAR